MNKLKYGGKVQSKTIVPSKYKYVLKETYSTCTRHPINAGCQRLFHESLSEEVPATCRLR